MSTTPPPSPPEPGNQHRHYPPPYYQPPFYQQQPSPGGTRKPWWNRKLRILPVWAWLGIIALTLVALPGALIPLARTAEGNTTATTVPEPAPSTSEATPVTEAADTSPPTTAQTSTTQATGATAAPTSDFSVVDWYLAHYKLMDEASSEMTKAQLALGKGDYVEMARASHAVEDKLGTLAASLEDETHPSAVALREAFESCSIAYGMAADAAVPHDADALAVAGDRINTCSSDMKQLAVYFE